MSSTRTERFYCWVGQGLGKLRTFVLTLLSRTLLTGAPCYSIDRKTICIAECISRDRMLINVNAQYSQLFVARSPKICDIVKGLVGSEYNEENQELRTLQYVSFKKLTDMFLEALSTKESPRFASSRRMDFQRFKKEFSWPHGTSGLDLLVLWTQIRSFIKGSVEALINPGPQKG